MSIWMRDGGKVLPKKIPANKFWRIFVERAENQQLKCRGFCVEEREKWKRVEDDNAAEHRDVSLAITLDGTHCENERRVLLCLIVKGDAGCQ